MEGIKTFVKIVKKEGFSLRLKFTGLLDRISVPEIHLEWREIVESIMLMLFSMFLYMSIIFTQFAFFPVIIVTIKRGWKETAVYITAASVLLLYMMVNKIGRLPMDNSLLLFSPIHFTLDFIGRNFGVSGARFLDYYFIFGGMGIFIGHLVSRNYRLNYVMLSGMCLYMGLFVLILSLSGLIGGFKTFSSDYSLFVDNKINRYISLSMAQIDNYSSVLSQQGLDYNLLEKKLESAAEIYKRGIVFGIAPKGGIIIKQIVFIFLSILFVKLYFKGKLTRAALTFTIKNYTLADDWVWGLISAWGLVYLNFYINSNLLGIVSWNSAVIISFLFFLKGLSIIKLAADRMKVPQFLQYVVLFSLFFYFFIFFVVIITGIGVIDIWLKLHENLKNIEKRRDA
jgi:hypothetical protein